MTVFRSAAFARTVLVAITLLAALIFYIPAPYVDFLENWGDGTFGIRFVPPYPVVIAIRPGSPAARAGIAPGDRLVAPVGADSHVGFPIAGEVQTLTFARRGAMRTVRLRAVPVSGFTVWRRVGGVLAMVPATVFLVVAFLLVFLRPGVMTWSFYVFSLGYFGTQPASAYFSHVLPEPAFRSLLFIFSTLLSNVVVLTLLPFILRFPSGRVPPMLRKLDAATWTLIAAAYAYAAYNWIGVGFQTSAPYYREFQTYVPLLGFAIAAGLLLKKYAHSPPEMRRRLGFLVLGAIISFVAYAVYFIPGVPFGVGVGVQYAAVALPIAVAYAVLHHRVIDVNFVLNRAVVYGVLSILVIAFISLLDFLSGQLISAVHAAVTIALVLTIIAGFALDRINRAVEAWVDATLFRKRHVAERFLKRVASALPYATGEDAISDGLVHEPVEALELTAGALYRRTPAGDRFTGVMTASPTLAAPPSFDRNHNLVRFLQADEQIVWLDQLRSHLAGVDAEIYVLAVPVCVRHELIAFTLYGAHRNGAQIDPDEVAMLESLAREAGRAYDHIDAVRTRELLARLTNAPAT